MHTFNLRLAPNLKELISFLHHPFDFALGLFATRWLPAKAKLAQLPEEREQLKFALVKKVLSQNLASPGETSVVVMILKDPDLGRPPKMPYDVVVAGYIARTIAARTLRDNILIII